MRVIARLTAAVMATVIAFTAANVPALPAAGGGPPLVHTDRGALRGNAFDGCDVFEGIPYAAPPVGSLRWKAPAPARPWHGLRDATAPGSRCLQSTALPNPIGTAEDCLYLNVTTPSADRHRRRPTIVWLHGGSLTAGAGSDYIPRRLAVEADAVVVTVNYRLGIFGYFGHPRPAGSGTFGLQDQMAALAWTRRNAAAFGGDPTNVTVAGQSSGAFSICSLLVSPAARTLFDRAVLQSGPCVTDFPPHARRPGEPASSPWAPVSAVKAQGRNTAAVYDHGEDGGPGRRSSYLVRSLSPG